MRNKPHVEDVARAVPEARGFEEIGVGGFKVVYRAQIGQTTEAIKLVQIPDDEQDDAIREENVRRVRREIDILGKCGTPYLVKLGSIVPRQCRIDSTEYVLYSEEYVPGESLRDLVKNDYRPGIRELSELARCLLKAIQELAEMNVIHRDIKPDNTIKTELEARPYVLLDLGIAFQIGGTPITHDARRIPGTLYYIAPEMLDLGFRHNLDYRADLYTLGLTLYEFASADQPFARRSDPHYTTLYRIKTETPKPLREHRPDLPSAFCELVDQLMKKLPALRPSNIAVLLTRIEGFL